MFTIPDSFSFMSSSSLVLKILKDAYDAGKQFRVVVVDSRPKFEGSVNCCFFFCNLTGACFLSSGS